MAKGILGRKLGMTQIFNAAGELIPVTVIDCTPNVVLQQKTVENDGYEAVQVGYEDKRESLSNKPEQGHVAKAGTAPKENKTSAEPKKSKKKDKVAKADVKKKKKILKDED